MKTNIEELSATDVINLLLGKLNKSAQPAEQKVEQKKEEPKVAPKFVSYEEYDRSCRYYEKRISELDTKCQVMETKFDELSKRFETLREKHNALVDVVRDNAKKETAKKDEPTKTEMPKTAPRRNDNNFYINPNKWFDFEMFM